MDVPSCDQERQAEQARKMQVKQPVAPPQSSSQPVSSRGPSPTTSSNFEQTNPNGIKPVVPTVSARSFGQPIKPATPVVPPMRGTGRARGTGGSGVLGSSRAQKERQEEQARKMKGGKQAAAPSRWR